VSVHCGVSQFFRKDLFCPTCDWCPVGYIVNSDGTACAMRPAPKCGPFEKLTPDGLGCMPRCSSLEEWVEGECRIKCGPNEMRSIGGD